MNCTSELAIDGFTVHLFEIDIKEEEGSKTEKLRARYCSRNPRFKEDVVVN